MFTCSANAMRVVLPMPQDGMEVLRMLEECLWKAHEGHGGLARQCWKVPELDRTQVRMTGPDVNLLLWSTDAFEGNLFSSC